MRELLMQLCGAQTIPRLCRRYLPDITYGFLRCDRDRLRKFRSTTLDHT